MEFATRTAERFQLFRQVRRGFILDPGCPVGFAGADHQVLVVGRLGVGEREGLADVQTCWRCATRAFCGWTGLDGGKWEEWLAEGGPVLSLRWARVELVEWAGACGTQFGGT